MVFYFLLESSDTFPLFLSPSLCVCVHVKEVLGFWAAFTAFKWFIENQQISLIALDVIYRCPEPLVAGIQWSVFCFKRISPDHHKDVGTNTEVGNECLLRGQAELMSSRK